MPIGFSRYERRDGADRNELALTALELCRRQKANPKVRSARYYWHGASEIVFITDGEPGWNDYNPNPDPGMTKALFKIDSLARFVGQETWREAGLGTRDWERADRPQS